MKALEKKLKEYGIGIDDLVRIAMSLYIYDPAIGSAAKLKPVVRAQFKKMLSDINVSCLITAALCIEQEGSKGLLPGITKEKYASDPVDLLADEIIGQGIALYIAGTRALFEFERLDKNKPDIIKDLPPMLDDAIIGLVSGVMVKVCSQ